MITKTKFVAIYTCNIPEEYLIMRWDEVPSDIKAIINKQNGLPCDGGGYPGSWCKSCHYFGGQESEDYLLDPKDYFDREYFK